MRRLLMWECQPGFVEKQRCSIDLFARFMRGRAWSFRYSTCLCRFFSARRRSLGCSTGRCLDGNDGNLLEGRRCLDGYYQDLRWKSSLPALRCRPGWTLTGREESTGFAAGAKEGIPHARFPLPNDTRLYLARVSAILSQSLGHRL
jgi:hypothetical protein